MKNLFMCLLLNLVKHGNLTEANMYEGGKFSNIKIQTEDGAYSISVTKLNEETPNED